MSISRNLCDDGICQTNPERVPESVPASEGVVWKTEDDERINIIMTIDKYNAGTIRNGDWASYCDCSAYICVGSNKKDKILVEYGEHNQRRKKC